MQSSNSAFVQFYNIKAKERAKYATSGQRRVNAFKFLICGNTIIFKIFNEFADRFINRLLQLQIGIWEVSFPPLNHCNCSLVVGFRHNIQQFIFCQCPLKCQKKRLRKAGITTINNYRKKFLVTFIIIQHILMQSLVTLQFRQKLFKQGYIPFHQNGKDHQNNM